MIRWRIYYGDGSTFSDRDGSPFDAPQLDVQVIAQDATFRNGMFYIHGKDAYVWKADSGWYGVNDMGFYEYLFLYKGPKAVLFGRTMARTPEFHECINRASDEGVGE